MIALIFLLPAYMGVCISMERLKQNTDRHKWELKEFYSDTEDHKGKPQRPGPSGTPLKLERNGIPYIAYTASSTREP